MRAGEIYRRLARRHDITLACMRYPGAQDRRINGINYLFLGVESRSLARSVFSYTIKAAQYVKNFGGSYDVIVENFLPATPFFAKYLTDTPVILQIQGLWGRNHIRKFSVLFGMPLFLVEKFYPLLYERFVFVTDIKMNPFMKRSGQYRVIPNGIDHELLRCEAQEDNYILFFSRIDIHQKGLDILVDSFRAISNHHDCDLVFAGYETNSMSSLLERLPQDLRRRVKFAGFVRGSEKIRLLSRAKIFVLPSRYEAHPISVMEALACGKPVIVSDIPEFKYITDHRVGLTFTNGSARDLADKILLLLENEPLRQSLGPRARSYVSRFLWDEMAKQFEQFLGEIGRPQAPSWAG